MFQISAFKKAMFATIGLALLIPGKAAGFPQQPPRNDLAKSAKVSTEVEKLIGQLGSSQFQIRQNATDQLWRLGPDIRPSLERAAGHADPEVRDRLAGILNALNHGLTANTPRSVAKLVLFFSECGLDTRGEVLAQLVTQNRFQVAFQLLEQVEKRDERLELYEYFEVPDLIERLADQDRWIEIESILEQPAVMEFDSLLGVHFQLAKGELEELTSRWREKLATREHDGLKIEDSDWLRLIAGLRMLERHDEAVALTSKITEPKLRNELQLQVLMERGDWQTIAQQMVLPDEVVQPEADKFPVNLAQQTIVHFFNRDQVSVERGLQQLHDNAERLAADGRNEDAKAARELTANVALTVLDWETAASHLDSTDRPEMFDLLIYQQRHAEALQAIELGASTEDRIVWFERRIRNLKSLQDKIVRLEDRDQETDQPRIDFDQTWQLCLSVAEELGSLGFTEQSLLYYRTLYQLAEQIELGVEKRTEILTGIMTLDRPHEVWKLIARGFEESEFQYLAISLFPLKEQLPLTWFNHLVDRFPDPLERLQYMASIVRAPLALPLENPIDIDTELSYVQAETTGANSSVEWLLAQTLRLYRRDEEANFHLQTAAEAGHQSAEMELGLQALSANDNGAAADWFDRAAKQRNSALYFLLAAEADKKMGNAKEAAVREAAGFTQWQNGYSRETVYYALSEMAMTERMEDFLRVGLLVPGQSKISNERYREQFARSIKSTNPRAAAHSFQIAILNLFTNENPRVGRKVYFAELTRQSLFALAQAEIAAGNTELAMQQIQQCLEFRPGDPEIGEDFVQLLDDAGATDRADELFEKIADFYATSLQQFPLSALHHNNYAWICARSERRLEAALRHCTIAVQQRSLTPSYLDTMAEVCFLLGDAEKAIELCHRCLEIAPNRTHYQQQLRRFKAN